MSEDANVEIQFWNILDAEWTRYGTYLNMEQAIRNLERLTENNPCGEYRLDPETIPSGWVYDYSYRSWIKAN